MNATLSPTAQAAIASIGGPMDLRLRTTLRRDDVDIWTSWMPCDRRYETLVKAPDDVYAAMGALRMPIESWYATKAEATRGHAQVVTRVGMLLQRRKARVQRYCELCDAMVTGTDCPACGADTVQVTA